MKPVERQRVWSKSLHWEGRRHVESLTLTGFPGFSDGDLSLPGGVSIFCGVNASGKTRLLNAMARSLETGTHDQVSVSGSGLPVECRWIDTFWLLQRQRFSIGNDKNLQDRVEAAGLTSLRAGEIRLGSYLLARGYDDISVAELEATDVDATVAELSPNDDTIKKALAYRNEVIPFFSVTRNGSTYDSRALSQGELAGLTLLWALRQTVTNELSFIDEPEAFLSPVSAARALDLIAYYSVETGSRSIVASHSYLGLADAPAELLVMLHPTAPGQVELRRGESAALWAALRISPPKTIILIVEDEAALQFVQLLLRLTAYAYADQVDVWIAGDSARVEAASKFPPDMTGATATHWGVFDGDERRKSRRAGGHRLFLPSFESPEQLILTGISSDGISIPGATSEQLLELLARHDGDEPHTQVLEMATSLGLRVAAFRDAAWRAWLDTDTGAAALETFRSDLSAITPPAARPS